MGKALTVLVAPGSFKESFDSVHVATRVSIGLKKASKKFNIVELPLADGGSGTVAVLTTAYKGEYVTCRVSGPLGNTINAVYGWVPQKRLAIIELAQAAGLALVAPHKRNPCVTTTRGVGELIVDAVHRGSARIILGAGDSATIDCGIGALRVLGFRFLDNERNEVDHNGQGLINLRRIDCSQCLPGVRDVKITIAADVMNKLTGKQGALVYARQKGATQTMMSHISQALKNFKKVVLDQYTIDVDTIPGAGAAGGIPAAFYALLNAEVRPGFELVAQAVHLRQKMRQADIVITGEGRIDKQSFCGKVVGNVVALAGEYKKPVILVAGSTVRRTHVSQKSGILGYYSLTKPGKSFADSMKNTSALLVKTAYTIGKNLPRQ